MSLKKAVAGIRKNKKFLITSHTNLEGDALGAELAFYNIIKKLGKTATIINEDKVPFRYEFMPHKNKILKFKDNIKNIRFDCFVVLDCSALSRVGEVHRLSSERNSILNIDHHIGNQEFGNINWIDTHASSCSEMIYRLYKALRVPLNRDAAILLYTGMFTDTGSFRYSNTTSFTHKAVSELMKFNLDIPQIYKYIYENMPFEDMLLISEILPGIKREAKGKVIWFKINKEMLRNKKLYSDITEQILQFGRSIEGVEAVVLFKENLGRKNEIKVNLRSQGKVDVNKVATFFGGGGHRTASGATIDGTLDQVRRMVLAKIKENL